MDTLDKLRKCVEIGIVSQIDLADNIGTNKQNVNAWIKGRKHIPIKYVGAINTYIERRIKRALIEIASMI